MKSFERMRKGLAYLAMPVLFCALGYALLYAALRPAIAEARAWLGLLVAAEAPNSDSELEPIYDREAAAQASDAAQEAPYLYSTEIEFPKSGTHYGQVTCAQIGLDCPVYWYDSDDILLYGAGQSLVSLPPGYGTAIILSGHNTTFFRCLEYAAVGHVITFDTNYGTYEYTVRVVEVYDEKELETILTTAARDEEHEQLIMYTCYPFYAISGRKTQRLVVFADRTSGIDVIWRESDER